RGRDVDHVEFLGERLDDDAETIEISQDERLSQGSAGELEAPSSQVDQCRQRFDRNALLRELLDVADQPMLARLGERYRNTLAAGPASAPDSVNVGVGRRWAVVVDDLRPA